ncbi:MAG: hypothetical protein RI556_04215 [Hydrogenovibrio sp.]|nr:hypothetical protein [Hydrogenovibrio sp.]MDR9498358.1 hypothetical protein [Hydrogenovibrio sp.]
MAMPFLPGLVKRKERKKLNDPSDFRAKGSEKTPCRIGGSV